MSRVRISSPALEAPSSLQIKRSRDNVPALLFCVFSRTIYGGARNSFKAIQRPWRLAANRALLAARRTSRRRQIRATLPPNQRHFASTRAILPPAHTRAPRRRTGPTERITTEHFRNATEICERTWKQLISGSNQAVPDEDSSDTPCYD